MIGNVVIVTSLPRTGTVSICRMLQILGYTTHHAALDAMVGLIRPGVAFADTPAFVPSIIRHVFDTVTLDVKHIYIDRDFDTWFDSMTISTRLLNTHVRNTRKHISELTPGQIADVIYYGEVFGIYDMKPTDQLKDTIREKFYNHREEVTKSEYSPLIYNFQYGWEPICEYLGINTPEDMAIPHAHKNSIGIQR